MKKFHRANHNYKFTERTHSGKGIAGLVLSLLSLAGGVALVAFSFSQRGQAAGSFLGSAGMLLFLAAVVAFGLSISGLREDQKYRTFPALSLFFSLVALVAWSGVYVVGVLRTYSV